MATIDDHLLRVRLLLARVNPSAAFRSPDNSILRRALWDLYSILEGPLQKEMYEIWKLCNAPAKFSQGLARLSAFLEAHPSSSPSGPTSMALAPSAGDHLASLGAQSSSLPENTTAAPVSREEFLPSRSPIVSRHPDSLTVSLRRGESPTNGLRRLLRNERLSQIGDYPGSEPISLTMSLPIQADLPAAEGDENQSMFHQRPRAITSAAVHGILSDLPAIEHVPTGAPWEVRRPQGRFEPHVSQPPAVRETSLPNVYSLQAFQSHPLSSTLTGATTGGISIGASPEQPPRLRRTVPAQGSSSTRPQRPGFISSGSSPLPIGAPPLRSQSSQKASRSPFPQVLSRAFSEPPPQQSGLTHVGQLAHPDAMGRYTHSESERHMFQQTASSNRGVPVSLPNVAANLPLCSMHPQQRSDDPGSLSKTVSSASTSPSSASKYWTPSEHPHYNSFPAASLLSPASTRVTVDIEPPQFLRSAPLAPHADPALQTAIMPSSARSELFRALSIEGVDPSLEASQSPLGPIGSPFIPPAPIERRPMERETFRQRIPYSSQLPATTTPSYHSSLIQRAEGDPDAHRYPSPGDLTSSGRFAGATGSSTPSLSRPLSFAPPVSSVDPFQLEAIGHLNEAMTQLELQDVATGYAEFVKNDNDKGAA